MQAARDNSIDGVSSSDGDVRVSTPALIAAITRVQTMIHDELKHLKSPLVTEEAVGQRLMYLFQLELSFSSAALETKCKRDKAATEKSVEPWVASAGWMYVVGLHCTMIFYTFLFSIT